MNKKTYSIVINNVKESVDAVQSLLNKLNELDQRLQTLSKSGLKVSAATSSSTVSKSKYDAAELEKKAQKEIADQLALQNEENQKALRLLAQKKQEAKEQARVQQQIAQGIRTENGEYANTLQGQRQLLADLKSQLANTDLGSDEWEKLRDRVAKVNDEVSKMEQSYGVFQRNVGNYASAAEGFKGISVTVDGVERKFTSLRSAMKELKMEMQNIDTSTAEGQQQFKEYERAIEEVGIAQTQMADKAERAMDANKGLHDALEVMEGFVSIAGVGQGLMSAFGIDNEEIGKSIQRLQGLMLALQGIQSLQNQFKSGTGIGGWVQKMSGFFEKWMDRILGVSKAIDKLKNKKAEKEAERFAYFMAQRLNQSALDNPLNSDENKQKAKQFIEDNEKEFKRTTAQIANLEKGMKFLQKTAKGVTTAFAAFATVVGTVAVEELLRFISESKAVRSIMEEWEEWAYKTAHEANKLGVAMAGLTDSYQKFERELQREVDSGSLGEIEAEMQKAEKASYNLREALGDLKKAIGDGGILDEDVDLGLRMSQKEMIDMINSVHDLEGTMGDEKFSEETNKMVAKVIVSLSNMENATDEDIKAVLSQLNNSTFFNTSLAKFFDSLPDKSKNAMQQTINNVNALADAMIAASLKARQAQQNFEDELDRLRVQAMPSGRARDEAQEQLDYERDIRDKRKELGEGTDNFNRYMEAREKVHQRNLQEIRSRYARQTVRTTSSTGKSVRDLIAESNKRIEEDRIAMMRDGLAKTIESIEKERRARIAALKELKKNTEQYNKELLSINNRYDKQILKEKKEFFDELQEIIRDVIRETEDLRNETSTIEGENELNYALKRLERQFMRNIFVARQYVEALEVVETLGKAVASVSDDFDLEANLEPLRKMAESAKGLRTPSLDEWDAYYKAIMEYTTEYSDRLAKIEEQRIKTEQSRDVSAVEEQYKKQKEELDDYYTYMLSKTEEGSEERLKIEREKGEKMAALEQTFNDRIKAINENAAQQLLAVENQRLDAEREANADYFNKMLDIYTKFGEDLQDKFEEISSVEVNVWGFIDASKIKEGAAQLETGFDGLKKVILAKKKELEDAFQNGEISLEEFINVSDGLDSLLKGFDKNIKMAKKAAKDAVDVNVQAIAQYIQQVGSMAQEMLQTLWGAQDKALDAQREALEKQNELLEEQLTKQEDITQKHADKINDIEDELQTARGDRRQHLIDALSAQIAAQRASLAAEQRIEKQKKANEKKMDALDKKRKEMQRKRDITSAVISAALATANGLATKPFVPVGIAMGALAAALGGAQVAIIAGQHYANGGVIEGPSHARGGVKVLGGRAEVEGGEFITNKRTTRQNIGVLEFINKSRRKLDVGDFIEYYSRAGKRSVSSVRARFADGGQLPDVNGDIDLSRLTSTVVVERDQRPIYVSVREIESVSSQMRQVRAVAGI